MRYALCLDETENGKRLSSEGDDNGTTAIRLSGIEQGFFELSVVLFLGVDGSAIRHSAVATTRLGSRIRMVAVRVRFRTGVGVMDGVRVRLRLVRVRGGTFCVLPH